MSRFTAHIDTPKKGWIGIFDIKEKGYVSMRKTSKGVCIPKVFKTLKGANNFIEKLEEAIRMQIVQK